MTAVAIGQHSLAVSKFVPRSVIIFKFANALNQHIQHFNLLIK